MTSAASVILWDPTAAAIESIEARAKPDAAKRDGEGAGVVSQFQRRLQLGSSEQRVERALRGNRYAAAHDLG